MSLLDKQEIGTVATVLAVIGFNLIMLLLLELPLLGYATRPAWTANTVRRVNAWLARNGGQAVLIGATAIGVVLIARGALSR
jgi:Sap, sulfolipid-1-addressing protein